MCVYVFCIYACVCLWCAKYKICIFGMYDTRSAKCENGVHVCVYVSICLCVAVFCVCGVLNIKLVSLECM